MANPQNPEQKPQDEPCDEPEDETLPTPETPPETGHDCDPLPEGPKPPELEDPEPCKLKCDCPSKKGDDGTCLDKLINDQNKLLTEAERAKTFKVALEELLGKAKAARVTYTPEKYDDFKKRWDKQDQEILGVIDTVVCNVKCWECLVECEICTLLYKIREIEERLEGKGPLIGEVHSLRDLKYWHERNRDRKSQQFERIKAVLAAWNDPAGTIEKALADNDKLIKSIRTMEPSEGVLQLFFKLIPLHLAIAPRPVKSKIEMKYRDLCPCDTGVPDDCCGPDAGMLSARQRLTEPHAYIVDPNKYFDILCCLTEQRYLPAKNQLATAESALAEVEARIASLTADLERRKKSVFDDYRASVVIPIDCDKYQKDDGCGCDDKGKPTADPTVR